MTTTARKGTGRPTAARKTAKAAQRTPADNLDSLSLGELRQRAVEQGWSTVTRASKTRLLKILRENPDGPPALARKTTKAAPRKPRHQEAVEVPANVAPKVARFRTALEGAGWHVEIAVTGDKVTATARSATDRTAGAGRGKETVTCAWTKGKHLYGDAVYSNGERRRTLRNLSEVVRLFGGAS